MTPATTAGAKPAFTADKALAALRYLGLAYRPDPVRSNIWWAECPRCHFAEWNVGALTLRLEEVRPGTRVCATCTGDEGCGKTIPLFYLFDIEEPPTLELARRRRQLQAQLEIASHLQAIRDLQPIAFRTEVAA